MNRFACNHLQDLKLDEFQYSMLSQSINIHKFDFRDSSAMEWSREEFEVAIEKSGQVDAILYWFEVEQDMNTKFSTLNSELYSKAAILLNRPVQVDPVQTEFVSIEFTYQDFLIDLIVSD